MIAAVPWSVWLQGFQHFRGISHDRGFIPLESIDFIVHLDAITGQPFEPGGNVVSFQRTPK